MVIKECHYLGNRKKNFTIGKNFTKCQVTPLVFQKNHDKGGSSEMKGPDRSFF